MPRYAIKAHDLRGAERELKGLLKKHNTARRRRIKHALAVAAQRGKQHVAANMPIAFKELVDSLSANPPGRTDSWTQILVDAPHAEAVELGSRPHVPPLAPLVAWVKLRGMQGLKSDKQLRKLRGNSTASHARAIASIIRDHQHPSGFTALDVPEQIARAIQAGIAKHGTQPNRFMAKAVPVVQQALYEEVAAAVPDR